MTYLKKRWENKNAAYMLLDAMPSGRANQYVIELLLNGIGIHIFT